jgi:hypothetical protein
MMANDRRRFEIALQLAQDWLDLAREKPTSHTCRSARQAAEAAAIRADGLRLGAAEMDLLHNLMAEAIRLDARHAVADDAVTAWLTARPVRRRLNPL